MCKAEPESCASILTAWSAAVRRLLMFPTRWKESKLSPLYKKGDQANRENYRSVSVLSHARKTIDATILTYVCSNFTPARTQFGFQQGISVLQSILQIEPNAQNGLTHVAVLDLAKAYDRGNRRKLTEFVTEHLGDDTMKMLRATLGPVRAREKRDPTDHWANMTRGCHKGRPRRLSISTYMYMR